MASLAFLVLGHHHKTRCVTVKAMHDKELVPGILPFHPVAHYRIGSTVRHLVIAHRQQPVALLDYQQVSIFVDELHPAVVKHLELSRKIHLYRIVGGERSVVLSDRHAVDSHLIVF